MQNLYNGEILTDQVELFMLSLDDNFAKFDNEENYLNHVKELWEEEERLRQKENADAESENEEEKFKKTQLNIFQKIQEKERDKRKDTIEARTMSQGNVLSDFRQTSKLSRRTKTQIIEEEDDFNDKENLNNNITKKLRMHESGHKTGSNIETEEKQDEDTGSVSNQDKLPSFIDSMKPEGLIMVDFPNKIDACLEFEKQISNYIPADIREEDKLTKLNRLTNMIYSNELYCKQYLERERLFFDLIFDIDCDETEVYNRAISDVYSKKQKDLHVFLPEKIIKEKENIKAITDFYETNFKAEKLMDCESDLFEKKIFKINSSLPEFHTIPKMEAIINRFFDEKKEHYKRLWIEYNKNKQEEEAIKEESKQLLYEVENNIVIGNDVLTDRMACLSASFGFNTVIQDYLPQIEQFITNFLVTYNDKANQFYEAFKLYLKRVIIDDVSAISLSLNMMKMDDLLDEKLQSYIKDYNKFIYEFSRLLDDERVKNELHHRANDLIDNINTSYSEAIKNSKTRLEQYFAPQNNAFRISHMITIFTELVFSEFQKFAM